METEIIPPSCCKLKEKNITSIARSIAIESIPELGENKIIEIIFVEEDEIRKYNKQYRKISRSTNVLTFVYSEFDDYIPVLASIILCLPVIKRRAELHGIGVNEELKQTLIHGLLHVAGYDHHKKKERERMRNLESIYMKRFETYRLI